MTPEVYVTDLQPRPDCSLCFGSGVTAVPTSCYSGLTTYGTRECSCHIGQLWAKGEDGKPDTYLGAVINVRRLERPTDLPTVTVSAKDACQVMHCVVQDLEFDMVQEISPAVLQEIVLRPQIPPWPRPRKGRY